MKKIALFIIIVLSISSVKAQCTVSVTSFSYSICSGNVVSLAAVGATSYTWIPISQVGNNILVSPTTNTTYTVLGATGACTGSTTCNVTVYPLPGLSVTRSNYDTICAGITVTLTANASNPVSYSWDNGSTLPTVILSPTVTTWFSVSATNPITGCSESLSSSIDVDTTCSVLGISEVLENNLISIAPNPSNGILNITSKTELQKIEIIYITGAVLLSEVTTSNNHTLHLENYSNGIYFVNVYQNNRIVRREKVIVNK